MPPSSTASSALAISQETSEIFVLGEKTVIFTNCKESDPGRSPALGFVSRSPDQCCQHTSLLKPFSVGWQLSAPLGRAHPVVPESKDFPLRVLQRDMGCLLVATFCFCAVS